MRGEVAEVTTIPIEQLRFRRAGDPAPGALAFTDPEQPRLSGKLMRSQYVQSLLANDLRAGIVDVERHPRWVKDVMRSWLRPKWRAL